MKTTVAIDRAGNPAALARMLGITPSAISQWGDEIPQARVWQLRVMKPEWFPAEGGQEPKSEAGTVAGQGA